MLQAFTAYKKWGGSGRRRAAWGRDRGALPEPLIGLLRIVTKPRIATTAQTEEVPYRRRRRGSAGMVVSTAKYLLRTEVHTFAFSVAANSILSFFPFVVLLMTLIRRVFHSRVMYDVVVELLRDYLPAGQEFVIRNLNAMVNTRHRAQAVSLIILLVTSSGIFMPLEVALNRVWRFPNIRSYIGNQLISLVLPSGAACWPCSRWP